jgi:type II secretory pathway pseudopilin PulG
MRPPLSQASPRQAGFTIIELTISLVVIVEVLLAILMLFDFTNKLSHAQATIADMQQSLRIAQNEMNGLVRAAGRGGLSFFNSARGGALWVNDGNVAAPAPLTRIGDASSPPVAAGTDVLTVRGVFSSPIYRVNIQDSTTLAYKDISGNPTTNPNLAYTGVLKVAAQSFPNGMNLQPLADAVAKHIHEALIIESGSNPDVHAVVELLPDSVDTAVDVATQATLAFRIRGVATDLATSYAQLIPGGAYDPTILSVGTVGILEEWRLYIRPVQTAADIAPKLTKARFMPGTDIAYGPPGVAANSDNLSIDLADDILDFQVALAADTTNHVVRTLPPNVTKDDCTTNTLASDPANCYISEAADGKNDDWLYNSTNDNITNPVWTNAQLYWVRLSLLARTDRRDKIYEAPLLSRIENRTYPANDPLNLANTAAGSTQERMYRRRILQTVIDVRNLS